MITAISVRDRMFAPAHGRYLDGNPWGRRHVRSDPRTGGPRHCQLPPRRGALTHAQPPISRRHAAAPERHLRRRGRVEPGRAGGSVRLSISLPPLAARRALAAKRFGLHQRDLSRRQSHRRGGHRCRRPHPGGLRIERAGPRPQPSLPGLVARDPALAPVLDLLRRAAPSTLPVTLLGESGTGKEVAARAVHELSERNGGPFVPLNCGAISRELAEAELFGHEKGAFTGAITSAPGAFGAADGGTLFLDEIGDLPLALQVKLLRALEAGEVKPVGAPRPRRIDVRVVCATHHDLRARV